MSTQDQALDAASGEEKPKLRLVVEDDEGKTALYELVQNEITIGRGAENTIRLSQRNISRDHVKLIQHGDGRSLLVVDLESYTGVKINDRFVQERGLFEVGDLLQLGDYSITLSPKDDLAGGDELPPPVPLLPEEQARLVVVSSNLAGREYPLNQRESSLGRVARENTIVISHRSISRNHAKVIHRDGEFMINDLGSSNGVRVNGEAFTTCKLRNGDFIEMGQVKLRYVAPGDDYHFDMSHVNDVVLDPALSPRPLIVIAGVVSFATLIVMLILHFFEL